MVFESLSTNEFGVVVGPRDLTSSNIQSLTTPALEKCFSSPARDYDSDDFGSEIRWHAFVSEIANGNFDRISIAECKEKSKKPATGIRGIVALADNLTVSDGGDTAMRLTFINNYNVKRSIDEFYKNTVPTLLFSNQTADMNKNITCQGRYDISTEPTLGSSYANVWNGDAANVRNVGDTRILNINECLLIKGEEHCQLLYSPPICLIIMLAAFAKISAMFLAAHIGRSRSPPLLTIGDAVASFMENPDPTTKGLCWITGAEVRKGGWATVTKAGFQAILQNEQNDPITYRRLKKRKFRGRAASGWRWAATLFM